MYDAMHHWKKHLPLLSSEYPYTAREGSCKEDDLEKKSKSPVPKTKGMAWINPTCDDLKGALETGPTSVAVDAGRSAWQFYSKGIVTNNCD